MGGSKPEEQRRVGLPQGGVAKGKGAEGRGARPHWPLKGRSSWGGHFNRPQLNHCRKLLTAPYGLSRTALLLGSQAVMQKERGLGPLTTHPRPPRPASPKLQSASKEGACLRIKGWRTCFDLGKPSPSWSPQLQSPR